MKKNLSSIVISSLFVIVVVFSSCKKDKEIGVTINFEHTAEGELVDFENIIYTNAAGNNFSVETIKYFISDITLIDDEGGEEVIAMYFYVDARDQNLLSQSIHEKISNKQYEKIKFVFGFTNERNESFMFKNHPEAAMEWPEPMGGGYHYMKLEGKFNDQDQISSYNIHTGMLNGSANYFTVELPLDMVVEDGTLQINLEMQIENWFTSPNNFDFVNITSGMMGNQNAQTLIQENGSDVFKIK